MKKILVPIDFSGMTADIIKVAAEDAKCSGAELVLFYVEEPEPDWIGFEPGPQVLRDLRAEDFHKHKQDLEALEAALKSEGIKARAIMVQGGIVEKILEEADKMDADLIVMGTHGHSALHDALLGGISKNILKATGRPILFVPKKK